MSIPPKPIYLPSSGLDYKPYAWLSPITPEMLLFEHDPKSSESLFAHKLSIIKHYTILPVDILDMYVSDLNYIWLYILADDIVKNGIYFINHICTQCKNNNYIKINLGEIKINYLNIYNINFPKQIIFQDTEENLIIEFSHRRAKHNLQFGHLLFNSDENDKEDYIYQIILFLTTQIDKITYNNQILPTHEYLHVLWSLKLSHIIELLKYILTNQYFGVYNLMQYQCNKCSTINKFFLFNDIAESQIFTSIEAISYNKQRDMLRNIFEFTRYPVIEYASYMNFPLRFIGPAASALAAIDFKSGVII